MQTLTIKQTFNKSDERTYFKIPFDIPEDTEKMIISYSYTGDTASSSQNGKQKNCIDMGLADNTGADVGTRGSSAKRIVISPSFATAGYHPMEPHGAWSLIIGAYQIRPEGVTVTFNIDFYPKEYRWLKGDTHLHTNHSDGLFTREQLAKKARKAGLDFIIFTDHNNNMVGAEPPSIDKLTAIKGLELTNYNGHANFWGVAKPYSCSFAINNREEFISAINEAKRNGALVAICHPHCRFNGWKFGDLQNVPFDFLEIWNGPMRVDNIKTINFWNELLKQGRKVPVVGGSDYHRDYVVTKLLAMPTTRVYANCNSKEAIFDALKNGRIVVTQNPHSTMATISANGEPIGSTLAYDKNITIKIEVTGLKRKHILQLIDNNGVLFSFVAPKKGNYTFEVPIRQASYVRCEVDYIRRGISKLMYKLAIALFLKQDKDFPTMPPYPYVVTNPIYFK